MAGPTLMSVKKGIGVGPVRLVVIPCPKSKKVKE